MKNIRENSELKKFSIRKKSIHGIHWKRRSSEIYSVWPEKTHKTILILNLHTKISEGRVYE